MSTRKRSIEPEGKGRGRFKWNHHRLCCRNRANHHGSCRYILCLSTHLKIASDKKYTTNNCNTHLFHNVSISLVKN